jgi:hypothetical protein
MYCPGCSKQSADGAKFCKACGMNLTVVTQALSGSVAVQDPVRDREYKRNRRQISDGISGGAIGIAILVAAGVAYALIPNTPFAYTVTLILALVGLIKLFRNIGNILDAKVGNRLLDPSLQPRTTGSLNAISLPGASAGSRTSDENRRLVPPTARITSPGTLNKSGSAQLSPQSFSAPPAMTGRVNREHSSPLRKLDIEDELMSRLRN